MLRMTIHHTTWGTSTRDFDRVPDLGLAVVINACISKPFDLVDS